MWAMRSLGACYLSLLALFLLVGSFGPALANDCAKAKEIYAHAVKLLNYEERRAAFQKAVQLCPTYAEAYCNLADAFENLGLLKQRYNERGLSEGNTLLDKAVELYKKALDLNKNLFQAHLGLAEIYLGQKRCALAEREYRRVLDLQPGHEAAREGLEMVRKMAAGEPGPGLVKSKEIIKGARDSFLEAQQRVMGIEDHTVKDRQTFNNILFEGWSARIHPGEPTEQVKEIGKALSSGDLAGFQFVVEGHTNIVGSFDDNMKLSWDRARSVKDYLVKSFHIDPDRLLIQGFGYKRPKFVPENDAKNRRVEIIFLQQNINK